jgi:hypothetical protein
MACLPAKGGFLQDVLDVLSYYVIVALASEIVCLILELTKSLGPQYFCRYWDGNGRDEWVREIEPV